MTGAMWIELIMRWLHILSVVTAIGGSIFMRLVLMPTAFLVLKEEEHNRLREPLLKRWQKIVHTCIALFLISGFYNYLLITRLQHEGQPLYHALFGIKFLLALGVFFLAIALTSQGRLFADLRARARYWLGILVAVALVIILISGFMRTMPKVPITVPQVAQTETQL